MPPSEKLSREQILQAGLLLVETEGLEALTARRVAEALKASTAPVYRQFASMGALAEAVMRMAREILYAYTADRALLDMAAGMVRFAREHPRLYQALFLESDRFAPLVRDFLPSVSRAQILWTYTHGLASLIAVGLARETSEAAIARSLDRVIRLLR